MTYLRTTTQQLWQLIKAHRIALVLIILCYAVTQRLIFSQSPLVGPYPDSPSYISLAHAIAGNFFAGDALRAYGYPIFLVPIFALTGENYTVLVVVQALLVLVTIIEVYILGYRLAHSSVVAAIPAILLASNIYVAQWERMVMTETLVVWVIVTTFLLFERYLTAPRLSLLIWIGFLSGWTILIRPNYIFLPLLIGVVVVSYHLMQQAPKMAWQRVAIVVGLAYSLVIGQMLINFTSPNHYFGISITADVNLLGKIIEYQMEGESTNPQYAQLAADLHEFIAQGGNIPWFFLDKHPQYTISMVGAYSRDIIIHHPFQFTKNLKRDLYDTMNIPPWPYGGIQIPQQGFMAQLASIARLTFTYLYRFGIVTLLAATILVAVERRRLSPQRLMTVTLTAFVVTTVLLTAVGNYGNAGYVEYYRLRFPADWALLLLTCVLIGDIIRTLLGIQPSQQVPAVTIPDDFAPPVGFPAPTKISGWISPSA